jgi:hypothetical protein
MSLDSDGPDIDTTAIAQGCGTSCLTGCVTIPITFAVAALFGITLNEIARDGVPIGLQLFGLCLGLASDVFVGYKTAQFSSQSPKLNVTILGIIFLVMSVFSIALSEKTRTFGAFAHLFFMIPAMLYGANLALDESE